MAASFHRCGLYNGRVKGLVRILMHALMLAGGGLSVFMCVKMAGHGAVRLPGVWIAGLLVFLLYLLLALSRMSRSERYTMKEFERKWIIDRAHQKGFLYHDKPGCYVIRIYRHKPLLPVAAGYMSVYVGQSMEVYRRVHNHLNRKGNGDVYADARDGSYIEIDIYPCSPAKLNKMEISLIRRYHAEDYYNRTAGGGTKRSRFGR